MGETSSGLPAWALGYNVSPKIFDKFRTLCTSTFLRNLKAQGLPTLISLRVRCRGMDKARRISRGQRTNVCHPFRERFVRSLGCYVPVVHTACWRLSWWRVGKRRRKQHLLLEISSSGLFAARRGSHIRKRDRQGTQAERGTALRALGQSLNSLVLPNVVLSKGISSSRRF